ncbi:ribonuclease HI family protein [Oxalicibacterium faecigallinarum]|uniref:RNase H type-1 domain-containing protein n=1 Tax=Oxalicibacterium faecigallinarum TaxID=573741 RepID=A0A8J3AR66_9BURK|nr:ribonuclease HI family protein [Oxalicibacterium faecigallinarum]GGI20426.1 hypothetical protein GCM10008066_23970 [Oxalicibacterium faecigallinarum]
MSSLPELRALAYKKEQAAARRLQRLGSQTEEQALITVLQQSAAPHTLESLLTTRRAAQTQQDHKRFMRRQHAIEQKQKRQQHIYPTDAWVGWFDGSASPNPGRMHIGAVLQAPDQRLFEISADAGQGDSSMAEYLALHALLKAAIEHKVSRLLIHGDSRVVIDDVLGSHGKRAMALARFRMQAQALMTQLQDVKLIWIPRHRNRHADALSQGRAISGIEQ